jgi:tRNA(fMet)-specific endonuclease VapC
VGIILDASIIIAGEKGAFQLDSWLAEQNSEIQLAAITAAELWHGVIRATPQFRARRERFVREILTLLPILPYTERTALEHARIWAELAGTGKITGYYDVIVAATALEHGAKIATFNPKHFAGITGLEVATIR